MIRNLKLSNSIQLEFLDKGEGEIILLLHGLGSTKADWDFQVDILSKKFRVIAPDLRGHGNSSKPETRDEYGIPQCAEDIVLLLQKLKIVKCSIVGFSMGGAVAFEMVVKHPELISKLIIVNTAPDFNDLGEMGKDMIKKRTKTLRNFGIEPLAEEIAVGMFPEDSQIQLRNTFYERTKKNSVEAYFNSFITLMEWGIGSKIKEISVPTLVIASELDYTPVSLKEAYAKKMKNSKVEVISQSRHGVTMDQPEEFNKIILNFLNNG
ncbi:alpha/beta hydrolase fold protein [Psychroflexus torquis ATCC 700755]|uniref:Alpha/beta hydrolase fold protein n=1 Tax=Psychroflexus torquis (strain ATCC 700755 / CIP 106069 / ACAM 623) TaxID=313595 RepID=K4IQJ6_PSYTT|nr:alpha/beta hydrolase [Psychroflexus torquis]AFU67765.1 alpha/beta hydrolase fold protein [Psychroflexus torquis ATCC 700755]